MIEISHRLLERIYQHARESSPHECCGILIGRNQRVKRVEDIFETVNVETRRSRERYLIDGKDFYMADKTATERGLEIIGFYHSHPGHPSIPSQRDLELAWQGFSYLIVSLKKRKNPEFKAWLLEENGKGFAEEKIDEI